jgi:two-component system cell cycle sensor histidine kinase/response regulator CckA
LIDSSVYEAMFHASDQGILIADDHARYVEVNDSACKILDRPREEVIGKEVGAFVECEGDAQRLREIGLRAGGLQTEIAIRRRDGERRQLALSVVADLQPGRHMVVISDLSQRWKLDAQIRAASKMEAVGRLAGGVAHDFNNLLMVITSYTELMLDAIADGDPLRCRAKEVLKASARAAGLTRQLLAFSRKQVPDPQRYDLSALIRETAKLLSRVLGEDVQLRLELREDLDKVLVDRGQIEQVMLHLAVNARDVMPHGGILTVRTANAQQKRAAARLPGSPRPGEYVVLSVEDSGSGMNEEVWAHLFEPFFSTKTMGTGLGLAAVYGIVKQSGGHIWVESELHKGSCFRMYLPRAEKPCAEPAGAARPVVAAGREIVVLLVEDDEELREATRHFLQTRGYTVLSACDGTEALSLATKFAESIDVLVSDLVLPGIPGWVLGKELIKVHPETRVLYMSGYRDAALLENAVVDTTRTFLRKPFRLDDLCAKIGEILRNSQQGRR